MNDKVNNHKNAGDFNDNNVFGDLSDSKTEAIIKKTEKVVSALCLVTNLLSDNDSIKWAVRDKGVNLISRLFSATEQNIFEKPKILSQTTRLINEIISLIEVAGLSKLVSEMNASIIKKELGLLKNSIEDINAADVSGEFLLSGLFDEAGSSYPLLENSTRESEAGKQILKDNKHKGHFYKGQPRALSAKRTNDYKPKDKKNGAEEKTARRTAIMNLFKKNKELSIKDISSAISGCSEKTIQRELNSLLKDKVIRKEGEKRWSKYYLNRV